MADASLDELHVQVGTDEPDGGRDSRGERHRNRTDAEHLGEPHRVHRPGTTERDQHEPAWIDAALNGDDAYGRGHVRVHDVVHGSRRLAHLDAADGPGRLDMTPA